VSPALSVFRYVTTNLLSGEILSENLPLTVQSFGREINTSGTCTASLNLTGSAAQNAANIAAVMPRRSVLWIFQDDAVVWNGIIWDWNHQSIASGVLPLGCSTLESLMAHRVQNKTVTYAAEDIFDMFRDLMQTYALAKLPNGQIAGLTYSENESGVTDTLTFDGTQLQTFDDALGTLVSAYEIEYSFRPYQDAAGNLQTNVDLAYPYLGQTFPASGLVYNFPGNLTDYAFQATGSTSINSLFVTASNDNTTSGDDTTLNGFWDDYVDLDVPNPILQGVLSLTTASWTSDTQVQAFAGGYIPQVTDTQLTPVLTLSGDATPKIRNTPLGSQCQFNATSALHPAGPNGEPGFTGIGRVTAWTCTPGGEGQTEQAQVTLGNLTLVP
jgi:hypothetical protein